MSETDWGTVALAGAAVYIFYKFSNSSAGNFLGFGPSGGTNNNTKESFIEKYTVLGGITDIREYFREIDNSVGIGNVGKDNRTDAEKDAWARGDISQAGSTAGGLKGVLAYNQFYIQPVSNPNLGVSTKSIPFMGYVGSDNAMVITNPTGKTAMTISVKSPVSNPFNNVIVGNPVTGTGSTKTAMSGKINAPQTSTIYGKKTIGGLTVKGVA